MHDWNCLGNNIVGHVVLFVVRCRDLELCELELAARAARGVRELTVNVAANADHLTVLNLIIVFSIVSINLNPSK